MLLVMLIWVLMVVLQYGNWNFIYGSDLTLTGTPTMFPIASLAGVESVIDIVGADLSDGDKIVITSAADCALVSRDIIYATATYVPTQSVINSSITVPSSLTSPGTYRFCYSTKESDAIYDPVNQPGSIPGYGPLEVEFTVEETPTFTPNISLAGRI